MASVYPSRPAWQSTSLTDSLALSAARRYATRNQHVPWGSAAAGEVRMRILVINPNASVEMSDVVREQLHAVARADVLVDVVNPPGAPPAIESALDEAACVPPMLALVRNARAHGNDAVVIACF